MRLSVLLLSAVLITPALGQRLGQTRQALVAESGAATEENHSKGTAIYRHESLKIEVTYKNDIAQQLVVTALDPLPDDAIRGILQLNTAGGTWKELQSGGPVRVWQRSDLAQARCARFKPRAVTLVDAPFHPPAISAPPAQGKASASAPPLAAKPAQTSLPFRNALQFILPLGVVFAVYVARQKWKRAGEDAAPSASAPVAMQNTTPPPLPVLAKAAPDGAPTLDNIGWENFELLVAEIFRRKGYEVEVTSGLGADGGKDVVLRQEGGILELVQCKNLAADNRVTAAQMRDFFGLLVADGAQRGHFVTTGYFSADAKKFAEGKPIQLLERAGLEELIAQVSAPGENLCDLSSWIRTFTAHAHVIDPVCPFCESPMKLRRGATGRPFWGCSRSGSHRCNGKRDGREQLLKERTLQPS
ncbi:MAG: restriction endonuclease [Chthoniobacterales bacterium]